MPTDMSAFMKGWLVQEKTPSFITCEVTGGLGNQLFQIAAGLAAAQSSNLEFRPFFSSSAYTYGGQRPVYWKTLFSRLSLCEDSVSVVTASVWKEKNFTYGAFPVFTQTTRLIGYFQSYRYFEHIRSFVLSKFSFPSNDHLLPFLIQAKAKYIPCSSSSLSSLSLCDMKTSSTTTTTTTTTSSSLSSSSPSSSSSSISLPLLISLHVRSYIEPDGTQAPPSIHCRLSSDYYQKAIDSIKNTIGEKLIIFLVFSDDVSYARTLLHSLEPLTQFVYVHDLENSQTLGEVGELKLMSMCDHHILANSTFSWWAGYLRSDSRTIIAPQTWFGIKGPSIEDLIPPTWTVL